MNSIKKEAVAETTAKFESNSNTNLTDFVKLIKSKVKDISFFLWRMNYELEESRQKHAALGNLWRQAGCCVALSMFRIGRVR